MEIKMDHRDRQGHAGEWTANREQKRSMDQASGAETRAARSAAAGSGGARLSLAQFPAGKAAIPDKLEGEGRMEFLLRAIAQQKPGFMEGSEPPLGQVTFLFSPTNNIALLGQPFNVWVYCADAPTRPSIDCDVYFYLDLPSAYGGRWYWGGNRWTSQETHAFSKNFPSPDALFTVFNQDFHFHWPPESGLGSAGIKQVTMGVCLRDAHDPDLIYAEYAPEVLVTRRARLCTGNFDLGKPRQEGEFPVPAGHPLNDPIVWPFPESECGFYLNEGGEETLETDTIIQLQSAYSVLNTYQDDDWFYFRRYIKDPLSVSLGFNIRFFWGDVSRYRSIWVGPETDLPAPAWQTPYWYLYAKDHFRPFYRALNPNTMRPIPGFDWKRFPLAGTPGNHDFQRAFSLTARDLPSSTGEYPCIVEIAQSFPIPVFQESDLVAFCESLSIGADPSIWVPYT